MELPFNTVYSKDMLDGERFAQPLADWPTKRAWVDYAFDELAAAATTSPPPTRWSSPRGATSSFVYRDTLWHGGDMLGTGVASFGHVSGVHFQNVDTWDEYLADARARAGCRSAAGFAITDRERLIREMILQLKLGTLRTAYFREKFGVDVLAEFAPAGRAWRRRGCCGWRATRSRSPAPGCSRWTACCLRSTTTGTGTPVIPRRTAMRHLTLSCRSLSA